MVGNALSKVEWHEWSGESTDNGGLIWGIQVDDVNGNNVDMAWFTTEDERDAEYDAACAHYPSMAVDGPAKFPSHLLEFDADDGRCPICCDVLENCPDWRRENNLPSLNAGLV